jgi:hypothetical protein
MGAAMKFQNQQPNKACGRWGASRAEPGVLEEILRTRKNRNAVSVRRTRNPNHTRMMIVTDYGRNEYRLFFMTEESEESFFDYPDKS